MQKTTRNAANQPMNFLQTEQTPQTEASHLSSYIKSIYQKNLKQENDSPQPSL